MEKISNSVSSKCHRHGPQRYVHLAEMGFGVCPECVRLGWYAKPVQKLAKREMKRVLEEESALSAGDLVDCDFKDLVN